jgi:hypothetical protein
VPAVMDLDRAPPIDDQDRRPTRMLAPVHFIATAPTAPRPRIALSKAAGRRCVPRKCIRSASRRRR